MYSLLRPLLFKLDAESAHQAALAILDWTPPFFFSQAHGKPVAAMGLHFPHAVGLAAGLDKNAAHLAGLARLGFAAIEAGTVTPRPQSGNPKPRLFRLPAAQALINRMGFNNHGVDKFIENVRNSSFRGILGINIGKNKDTSLADAAQDYNFCLEKVYPYASYITINISSPNTPDLRLLQQELFLNDLLGQITTTQKKLMDRYQRFVPLVVKLSPDEDDESLKKMLEIIVAHNISGVIATNTTCQRQGVGHLPQHEETGGLSGQPLLERATDVVRLIRNNVPESLCIIAAGGIDSPAAAREKLAAGATLLQLYTGLIYQGPQLVADIVEAIAVEP